MGMTRATFGRRDFALHEGGMLRLKSGDTSREYRLPAGLSETEIWARRDEELFGEG
jgi:hypothetical protein